MRDWRTTIIGICGGFVAILTLVIRAAQGEPVDLPTITNTINALLLAFGLQQAADSTKPPTV